MIKTNIRPHERVRAAMDMKGYNTYESLAKAMGISITTFTLKINGKRQFTLDECNRIANILGTTLDDIFFVHNVPK